MSEILDFSTVDQKLANLLHDFTNLKKTQNLA